MYWPFALRCSPLIRWSLFYANLKVTKNENGNCVLWARGCRVIKLIEHTMIGTIKKKWVKISYNCKRKLLFFLLVFTPFCKSVNNVRIEGGVVKLSLVLV